MKKSQLTRFKKKCVAVTRRLRNGTTAMVKEKKGSTTVVLKNLSSAVLDEHLHEIFEHCGKIISIKIDDATAFIEFKSVEEAEEAIRCFDMGKIAGRTVYLSFMRKRERPGSRKHQSEKNYASKERNYEDFKSRKRERDTKGRRDQVKHSKRDKNVGRYIHKEKTSKMKNSRDKRSRSYSYDSYDSYYSYYSYYTYSDSSEDTRKKSSRRPITRKHPSHRK